MFCVADSHASRNEQRKRAHPTPYLAALGLQDLAVGLEHRFCSLACAEEWLAQAASAAPDTEAWLPPSLAVRHHPGRGRCASELRAALLRNTRFKKHFGARKRRRYAALGTSVVRGMVQQFVDALNVDTAALFLGTLLSESSLLKSDQRPPPRRQRRVAQHESRLCLGAKH